MKRLGLVTAFFPPQVGGIEAYLQEFVRWYPGEVILFTPNTDISTLPSNVQHIPMQFFAPRPAFPSWAPMVWHLRKHVSDTHVEHIVLGHFAPYAPGIALLSRHAHIPWSTFLHGVDFLQWDRSMLRREIRNRTLRSATNIIANGNFLAGQAQRAGIARNKVIVAHPGVDGDAFYRERSKRFLEGHKLLGKRIVLSAGRLIVRKGFDTTIQAFALMQKQHPDAHLVILGDGPERAHLEQQAVRYGVSNKVHFMGVVTDIAQKRQWYSAADCFVMPTKTVHSWDTESFGMVYIEALACGTPVIASDIGGAADIVQHGVNGFRIGNGTDPRAIADALLQLFASRELQATFTERARSSVIPEFTWKVQFEKLRLLWNA